MTSYVVHQEAFPLYMGSLKYIRLVFLYVQFFSFCTSPTYNLSKFLATLLSPLVGESPSAVRNSRDFVSFVSSLRLDPDEVLVSFDVVSLFIKVPIDLALQVARRRLEADSSLSEHTKLNVDNIMKLLILCLNATYFNFRGVVYQQVFGTAMGPQFL